MTPEQIIFIVLFLVLILLAILDVIIIPFWKGFIGKKRELETITIGEFEIYPMRSKDGQERVWIQSAHEGGEFSTKDLEPFIKDFFMENYEKCHDDQDEAYHWKECDRILSIKKLGKTIPKN